MVELDSSLLRSNCQAGLLSYLYNSFHVFDHQILRSILLSQAILKIEFVAVKRKSAKGAS